MKELARRSLRQACRIGLLMRSRPLLLAPTDRILVLAPHSDDETLGCGALLASLARAKHYVQIAYFTDSAGSDRRDPVGAATIATVRRMEATQAMNSIGIAANSLHWLGAPDGRLKDLTADERAHWRQRLAGLLTQVQPAAVLLPSRHDGSSEHEAMFHLVAAVVPELPLAPRVLEFPVWSWWNPRFLWRQVGQVGRVWRHPVAGAAVQKQAMLACYQSQVSPPSPSAPPPLSAEFLAAFATSHEFFFETKLPS